MASLAGMKRICVHSQMVRPVPPRVSGWMVGGVSGTGDGILIAP